MTSLFTLSSPITLSPTGTETATPTSPFIGLTPVLSVSNGTWGQTSIETEGAPDINQPTVAVKKQSTNAAIRGPITAPVSVPTTPIVASFKHFEQERRSNFSSH
jgi:hypothetical protein